MTSELYVAAKMCPVCGDDSCVYETRERHDGSVVRRRRCKTCGKRFVTREIYERALHENKGVVGFVDDEATGIC